MSWLDGISYLWKSIFGYTADDGEEQFDDQLLYQQMVDDEIIELELSEQLIEMMLEQYKKANP